MPGPPSTRTNPRTPGARRVAAPSSQVYDMGCMQPLRYDKSAHDAPLPVDPRVEGCTSLVQSLGQWPTQGLKKKARGMGKEGF
ncbi:hypothetical protein MSAS_49130 [Mycobacterium saskatchewanense]|nr:hypothetical protein MSAS_49130 [Mycobacterium saskatchewanense]